MDLLALVDGFNVYHSVRTAEDKAEKLIAFGAKHGRTKDPSLLRNYHWLDLPGLIRSYQQAISRDAQVTQIRYYSAYATHTRLDVVARHRAYVAALEAHGVETRMHSFKPKDVWCPNCRQEFVRNEEKETDVAIAADLIEAAVTPRWHGYVLVSGDTDLAPAIRTAQRLAPQKPLYIVFPFMRHNASLQPLAKLGFDVGLKALAKWQWPKTHVAPNGTAITRPTAYD